MAEVAEHFVPVDLKLRFALFGLECALNVTLDAREMERVFRDASENQVSSKEYIFHRSARVAVSGRVDEYEPDTIQLRVDGPRGTRELVCRVIEAAGNHAVRAGTT